MSARHFLEPLLRRGEPARELCSRRTGRPIATEIELTVDSQSRRRGLLGRAGLSPDAALIIAPCNAVHTFFMRFTIDVVFADRDGRVLKLCANVRPWRLAIALRGFAAIELAAGAINRTGLGVGDELIFTVPQPTSQVGRERTE